MNRIRIALIAPFAVIALAVATLTAAAAPAVAQSTAGTKVAVANPAMIFQEIQETKDLKASMEAQQKQLMNQETEKKTKLKDLQAARDALKSDSPAYAERNKDLMQFAIEVETWGRVQQMQVQAEQKRQMLNIFVKIRNAVQEVATAKGIDIVVAAQRPEFEQMNLDQLNVEQLRGVINSQNVLFNTPQTDISNDVVAAMDAKYKLGK